MHGSDLHRFMEARLLRFVGRALLLLSVLMLALITFSEPASAVSSGSTLAHSFDTAAVISYAVGTVLPLLVAVVTKASWPASLKGALLLAFSVITAFLTQWLDDLNSGRPFPWQSAVVTALVTFVTGYVVHRGAWGAGSDGGLAKFVADRVGPKDQVEPSELYSDNLSLGGNGQLKLTGPITASQIVTGSLSSEKISGT